ncbi:hypothetical protein HPB50_012622 [Hyalomma asiaticum]|uniref:Uncharacterized protein n=1 Tax=Hyalomma asiaticum TaxID=266040 RepID=A0ACB7S564_HYAAI|nr:hypothetical protein HPB50_012622 [Hyalomma asiaticum]
MSTGRASGQCGPAVGRRAAVEQKEKRRRVCVLEARFADADRGLALHGEWSREHGATLGDGVGTAARPSVRVERSREGFGPGNVW